MRQERQGNGCYSPMIPQPRPARGCVSGDGARAARCERYKRTSARPRPSENLLMKVEKREGEPAEPGPQPLSFPFPCHPSCAAAVLAGPLGCAWLCRAPPGPRPVGPPASPEKFNKVSRPFEDFFGLSCTETRLPISVFSLFFYPGKYIILTRYIPAGGRGRALACPQMRFEAFSRQRRVTIRPPKGE